MNRAGIEKISKALADQTRLKIFEAIAARDQMSCSQIVGMRGVTPATVSHHLKILSEAGLIECRRCWKFVHSRVLPGAIADYSRSLARLSRSPRRNRR